MRVGEKTKQRATKTLAAMGISVSDAVRTLLIGVVAEKALPFDVKVPNTTTVKAMRAADKGEGKRLTSAGELFILKTAVARQRLWRLEADGRPVHRWGEGKGSYHGAEDEAPSIQGQQLLRD